VRVEDPEVFDHLHARVLELVRSGTVAGLRLDHVDGLTDPEAYLERLRSEAGPGAWIVVEKILAPGEGLADWPVAGTTGYDFLGDVLALFVDPAGEGTLTATAHGFAAWPGGRTLAPDIHAAKREALEQDLAADTERLVDRFWALTQQHRDVRDVTRANCRSALLGVIAALDVYRVYTVAGRPATAQEASHVEAALTAARGSADDVPAALWPFLTAFLGGHVSGDALHAETLRRFHQVASAAMAKGVEDTLLYRQHRLVALNEVGVEAEPFGGTVAAFHAANCHRAARHAEGLLATSTHDTKRGEDVRLRIAALSEVPHLWRDAVQAWSVHNAVLAEDDGEGRNPDPATEYLCYQTLVGVWPPGGQPAWPDLRERVSAYLVKATREAGLRTSWVDPDERYERGLTDFVERLLDEGRSGQFLEALGAVAARAGEIAMASSLAQTLLRTTSPGVPDTYQGMELWRDDLVDPDNRRPVDFAARARLLAALDAEPPDPAALLAARADGRVKLWVLHRALGARRAHDRCFGPAGGYEPLPVEGRHAERVVAFARTGADGDAVLTLAPRLVGPLTGHGLRPPVGAVWEDTTVRLPGPLAGRWQDVLGGPGAEGASLPLARLFAALPVALLERAVSAGSGPRPRVRSR
jgi:(1->4)-alpha-D-glucan 1-alpha-D-glucosylmutase